MQLKILVSVRRFSKGFVYIINIYYYHYKVITFDTWKIK